MEFRIKVLNKNNPSFQGVDEKYSNRKEAREDAVVVKENIIAAEKSKGTRGKHLDVKVRPVRNDEGQSPSTSNQKTKKR